MKRYIPTRATMAVAALAALGAGSLAVQPCQAAVLVQTATFSHTHNASANSFSAETRLNVDVVASHSEQAEEAHFAGFDSTLGTLTGVRLQLTSTQVFGAGVSIVGGGIAVVDNAAYTSAVSLNGGFDGLFSSYQYPDILQCFSLTGVACLSRFEVTKSFDLDVAFADLDPFRTADGVDFGAFSHIGVESRGVVLAPQALLTTVGVLDWKGAFSLSYTYSPLVTPPGGVPEPATWAMMVLGFAGLGGALRRRARAAAA